MSNLTVSESTKRILILTHEGRLDAMRSAAARQQADELLADGAKNFLVDLSQVTFMDSAGVAVLVNLLKKTRLAGGEVKLIRPSDPIAFRILRLTKFDQVFEIFDSVETALKSF